MSRYDGRLLTPPLLWTLAGSCPRLQSLELHINGDKTCPEVTDLRALNLDGFRDLQRLRLFYLPSSDRDWWIPRLAQLLKNSPHLKLLGLGFTPVLPPGPDIEAFKIRLGASMRVLDRLCDLYASEGASPLRLESLEFVGGIYPCSLGSLQKLTDLTCLNDVLIRRRAISGPFSPSGPKPIAFEAFAPPHAPNLRFMRVDWYNQDLHEHLCALDPSFARALAISAMKQDFDSGFETAMLLRPSPDHPSIPLPVRMLNLQLDRQVVYMGRGEVTVSAQQVLDDLVSAAADSLEGLTVNLPLQYQDPDVWYTMQLLEGALARLPNLTQLIVAGLEPRLWRPASERLARASPRLRFINMHARFWRVWRNDDGTVRLETIKKREADRVELWKYHVSILTPITPNCHSMG